MRNYRRLSETLPALAVCIVAFFYACEVRAGETDCLSNYQTLMESRLKALKETSNKAQRKALKRILEIQEKSVARIEESGDSFWARRTLWYLLELVRDSMEFDRIEPMDGSPQLSPEQRLFEIKSGIEAASDAGQLYEARKEKLMLRLLDLQQKFVDSRVNQTSQSSLSTGRMNYSIDSLERDLQANVDLYVNKVRVGPLDNRVYPVRILIDDGLRAGRITAPEAERLNEQFTLIRMLENRWSTSDGYVMPWELQTLNAMTDELGAIAQFILAGRPYRDQGGENSESSYSLANRFPCIWYPSRHVGYFDITGKVNGDIYASELHHFGGIMSDGTPVPETGAVRQNATKQLIR